MIYDAFLFSGELDMLECRLTELDDMHCRFIIAEATRTFQGKQKPLYYLENKERFAPWADRITYVRARVPALWQTENHWVRENEQRNQLLREVIARAHPKDRVIFGDVDEIPRNGCLLTPGTVLEMQHRQFAVDWLNPEPWCGSVIQEVSALKPGTAWWLRGRRFVWPLTPNGGWHLSWLGGVDAAKEKAYSFSHADFTDTVCKWLDEGHCLGDGVVWDDSQDLTVQQLRVNSGFPRWVREGKCPGSWFRWK